MTADDDRAEGATTTTSDPGGPRVRHRMVVRAAPRRHTLVLGLKAQLALAAALFLLSAWLTVSTVSYVGSSNLLTDKSDYINNLESAYKELLDASRVSTEALVRQVEELEQDGARQELAIAELNRIQKTLQRQLESRERQLSALERERDRAEARLARLEDGKAESERRLIALTEERATLADDLQSTEARLVEVARQRDSSRRVEQSLRWQVAHLETQIGGLAANRGAAQEWFEDWVVSSVESLEQLFIGTGVELEELVARAASDTTSQGGPFQGIEIASLHPEAGMIGAADPITDHIRRLSALQKLASSLPLASPLDHFHITSYFGKRNDPFTRNWAFHAGLDFGAAPGSKVLVTAPGTVAHAGPAGPYGNMVEIDHGMGVTTRYGHLNAVSVEAGQEVDFRHPIGVIGNTGRSTGRHLHYEVRFDDQPLDPAKFLEAGRYLVDVFNFKPQEGGGAAQG